MPWKKNQKEFCHCQWPELLIYASGPVKGQLSSLGSHSGLTNDWTISVVALKQAPHLLNDDMCLSVKRYQMMQNECCYLHSQVEACQAKCTWTCSDRRLGIRKNGIIVKRVSAWNQGKLTSLYCRIRNELWVRMFLDPTNSEGCLQRTLSEHCWTTYRV